MVPPPAPVVPVPGDCVVAAVPDVDVPPAVPVVPVPVGCVVTAPVPVVPVPSGCVVSPVVPVPLLDLFLFRQL